MFTFSSTGRIKCVKKLVYLGWFKHLLHFYSLAGAKVVEGGGSVGGGGVEDGEGIKLTRERGGATPSVLGCDRLTDRKRW